MRTTRGLVASLMTVLAAGGGQAEPNVRQLTLEECIQIAIEHNLDLKIAQFDPLKAEISLSTGFAGFHPEFYATAAHSYTKSPGGFDPEGRPLPAPITETDRFTTGLLGRIPSGMSYSITGDATDSTFSFPAGFSSDNVNGGVTLSARQPLLKNMWIDQPRYNIRIARNQIKYSEQVLRFQVISTLTSVENAYFNLIQARENVKVQEEALRLAEKLFEENKKRVEVGALAPLDEKQAEAETAMRRADLLSAKYSLTTAQNVLKGLLSGNFPDWDDVLPEPAERLTAPVQLFNQDESWRKALEQRPDLLQARLEIERTGVIRQFQFNQLFPQLDLFGSYGHRGANYEIPSYLEQVRRAEFPSHAFGAELRIPLGNRAARNNHRLAKIEEEQSRLRLKKLEQDILIAVNDAIAGAETAYEAVKATERARVVAKEALDAEEKKRANGKSTSFFVLQLQKAYTDAQAAEIRALASYNRALTQLAFSEGSTLDRRGIQMELPQY